MRILHLLSQRELTGAEVSAMTMAEYMSGIGAYIHFASDTLNIQNKYPYHRIDFNNRILYKRLIHIREVLAIIAKHKIDIVHSHSRASAWVGEWATRLKGIPHIVSVHMFLHKGLSQRINPCLGDITLPFCKAVFEYLVKEFNTKPEDMEIFPNMIDCSKFKSKSLDYQKSMKRIAFIGRQTGPKGERLCWLIERIIPELTESFNLEFCIYGSPRKDVDEAIREVNRKAGGEKIKQMGFIENVQNAYYKADVVVGSGRVPIEAILCGRPVIAVGERSAPGLITDDNLQETLDISFGDCSIQALFNEDSLIEDFMWILGNLEKSSDWLNLCRQKISEMLDMNVLGDKLYQIYMKSLKK
jgi:glycosyltransferase involved in cell wall biosynthesis